MLIHRQKMWDRETNEEHVIEIVFRWDSEERRKRYTFLLDGNPCGPDLRSERKAFDRGIMVIRRYNLTSVPRMS